MRGTASTATYGDGTITTADHDGMTLAWATRGTVLLLGPEVTVKAALDTQGASPVAASSAFVAAKAAAPGAYLGFGYLDTATLLQAVVSMAGSPAGVPAACLDSAMAAAPGWSAGFAHAAGGARLDEKLRGAPAIVGVLGVQRLEGDALLQGHVLGEIDYAHPALTDEPHYPVSTDHGPRGNSRDEGGDVGGNGGRR